MHPHLTAVPGVPRIIDLSRFRNMGVLLLTCTTRIAFTISLDKDTPNRRLVERKPASDAVVISNARLGGLHHRYGWREAA